MGLVLLPRRRVVERSFGRMARFRRLARDDERSATTLEGLHDVAFSILMLHAAAPILAASSSQHPLNPCRIFLRTVNRP